MKSNIVAFAIGVLTGAMVAMAYYKRNGDMVNHESEEERDDSMNTDEEIAARRERIKAAVEEIKRNRESMAKREREEVVEKTHESYSVYEITVDEFGEFPDYECIYLTCFSDGTVVDEYLEEIDREIAAELIDIMEHSGEKDEVHIRDDNKCCDYEITKDLRTLEGALGDSPRATFNYSEE